MLELGEGSEGFHSQPNIVFLSSVSEHTEFIFQHGHFIELYTIDFEEDIPEEELHELEQNEEIAVEAEGDALDKLEAQGSSDSDSEGKKSVVLNHEERKKYPMKPIIRIVQVINVEERDDQGKHVKSLIRSKVLEGIKFQVHPVGHHSAHPKQYLFLNDHVNLYQIDLKTEKVTVFERKNSAE